MTFKFPEYIPAELELLMKDLNSVPLYGMKDNKTHWQDGGEFTDITTEAARLYFMDKLSKSVVDSLGGKPISELTEKLRADGHGVLLDDAFRDIYKHLVKSLEKEVEELRKAKNELFAALNGVIYWDNGKPEWADAWIVRDKYKPEEEGGYI